MAFQSFIGMTSRFRFESQVIDAGVGMPDAMSSALLPGRMRAIVPWRIVAAVT